MIISLKILDTILLWSESIMDSKELFHLLVKAFVNDDTKDFCLTSILSLLAFQTNAISYRMFVHLVILQWNKKFLLELIRLKILLALIEVNYLRREY